MIPMLLAVWNPAAQALESTYEKRIARGVSYTEGSEYPEAAEEFRAALRERPEDLDATLYLGVALSRVGDPEAEPVLKKALAQAPDNPRTNLELGILYFARKVYAEAGDYFDTTLRVAPGSDYADAAEEYLRRIRQRGEEKRWMVRFLTGMQYDSNVVLNADGSPLPQGITHKSDWRGLVHLKGSYSFVKSDRLEATAGYSLYQSLHTRLDDFNITQNLAELGVTYEFSPLVSVKGGYSFEYLFLGGDDFDLSHSVGASLILTEGEQLKTMIDYRFRDNHFRNTPLFFDNSDRTGANHQVGLTQTFPMGGSASGRLGYYHDEERTRRDFWDYSGDRGSAGVSVQLPFDTLADLTGEVYSRRYAGISPFSTVSRDDLVYTGSATATKFFDTRYGLTLGFHYNRNQSNLPQFDYTRTITSVLFSARF